MTGDGEQTELQTTTISLEILEFLEQTEGARISELATELDKSKSTIHGHLSTLHSKQYVVKRGDLYTLGPKLLRLGNHVRTRREGYLLAREYTQEIFESLGYRTTFAVEMNGRAVFLDLVSGEKMGWVRARLGNQLYLHNTAVGKSILANLPRQRVEQILDTWGLPRETEQTITDRETLFAELADVQETGYAVNDEENLADLYGIGVAAIDESGQVIGGFSITGSKQALSKPSKERDLAEEMSEIVSEYEIELRTLPGVDTRLHGGTD